MFSRIVLFVSILWINILMIFANVTVRRELDASLIICNKRCDSCQLENGEEVICDFSALKLGNDKITAVLRAEFNKEKNEYDVVFFSQIGCIDVTDPEECSPVVTEEVIDLSNKFSCKIPEILVPTRSPPQMNDELLKDSGTVHKLVQSDDLEEKPQTPYEDLHVLLTQARQVVSGSCRAAALKSYIIRRR